MRLMLLIFRGLWLLSQSAIDFLERFPSEERCVDIISGSQVHPHDKVTDLSANIIIR